MRISNLERTNLRRLTVSFPAAAVSAALDFTIRAYNGFGRPVADTELITVKVINVNPAVALIAWTTTAGGVGTVSTARNISTGVALNGCYLLEVLPVGGIMNLTGTATADAASTIVIVRCGNAQAQQTISWDVP